MDGRDTVAIEIDIGRRFGKWHFVMLIALVLVIC